LEERILRSKTGVLAAGAAQIPAVSTASFAGRRGLKTSGNRQEFGNSGIKVKKLWKDEEGQYPAERFVQQSY
jgi:hypothetical protein